MSNLKNYILLCALFVSNIVFAQFDRLHNYNVKDGLSSSEMYGVMQDAQGYIWSIGDMGVSRFNGYEFKNFSSENGMPDNSVFGIYQDVKNRIWFRSLSGKLSYFENDKINTIECNDTLEKIFNRIFITSIYIDTADTIWLGSTSNFIVKILPGWKKSDIRKVEVPEGKYFINFKQQGLIFGGNNPERLLITEYNTSLKKINAVDPDMIGEEVVGYRFFLIQLANGHYVASLNNKIITFQSSKIINQREEKAIIIYMLESKNENIIAGTYDGVFIYSNEELGDYKTIPQLRNKIITGLCIDKEDGLWITSEGHGLYYIPHRNFSYYTPQNGISESKISCIGTNNSKVVIGHLDGTASLLYNDYVLRTSVTSDAKNFAQTSRLTSVSNYENKTIVTTMQSIYYLENSKLKNIPEFINKSAKKFIRSNDGNILALHYGRIVKYDPKNAFRIVYSKDLGLRTDNLFEDSHGKLWISAANGVYTYYNKVLEYLGEANKLFAIRAVDICETKNHEIWVATRGGGVIVKKGEEVIQITEEKGLAGNMCRSLFSDSNAVWVGTNKGLSKITYNPSGNYEIENYYEKNGLLTNEVNNIIKHNNKLWLAHNNGISIFNPANIKSNTYPPPQCITGNSFSFTLGGLFAPTYTSFNWNFGASALPITSTLQAPTGISYNSAGSFPVSVIVQQKMCQKTLKDTVEVYPIPIADFVGDSITLCDPASVTFTNNSVATGTPSYVWQFSDGGNSTAVNPIHIFSPAGVYNVTLTIIAAAGCSDTSKFVVPGMVTVTPRPQAAFTRTPTETSIFEPDIIFTDVSTGASIWQYYFGDGESSASQNPLHTYTAPGEYNIIQTVTNSFGCVDTAVRTVKIIPEFRFWVPNSFTPKNQDGMNDIFLPIVYGVEHYVFEIYDRWGEKIFKTNETQKGWDGTRMGSPCQQDVYVWMITFWNIETRREEVHYGSVTILK